MNDSQKEYVSFRAWLGVTGAMLGQFMAYVDISVANSSLKEIGGSLSATVEEGSWVTTSYLIAEIIAIPLTAWLSDVFSRKRYLLVNCVFFLIFSIMCGFAKTLNQLIVFRFLQGLTGGVLIPLAQAVIQSNLPPSKRPNAMLVAALTISIAPMVGSSLGGWITSAFGWEYSFFLNIVPGVAMISMIYMGLPQTEMKLELLKLGLLTEAQFAQWVDPASMLGPDEK